VRLGVAQLVESPELVEQLGAALSVEVSDEVAHWLPTVGGPIVDGLKVGHRSLTIGQMSARSSGAAVDCGLLHLVDRR